MPCFLFEISVLSSSSIRFNRGFKSSDSVIFLYNVLPVTFKLISDFNVSYFDLLGLKKTQLMFFDKS